MAIERLGTLAPDTSNADIMNAIRNVASGDYQSRIPAADKANISNTVKALTDPTNRRWLNEFTDALVNRIGLTIVRSNSWTNPLAPFKSNSLMYGSTIEEIQVGLLKAHNYDPDRDYMEKTLFGREVPEIQANFHTINRQDFYKVSVNEHMLKRAFDEPTGLSSLVNQLMEAPSKSDQWDEFLLTCSLFREYESNGGFHHIQVPDVASHDSDERDSRTFLRRMRSMAGNMRFLSSDYNAAGMPIATKPEDLLLFVTPEVNAALDVEALAAAFNIERAQVFGRIIELPESAFGIDGCQAILTTKEFFVIADSLFETTSQWNPVALMSNYFLHHHQIISCSRFAPAAMFTINSSNVITIVPIKVTGVTDITFETVNGVTPTGVVRGGDVSLLAEAVTSPASNEAAVIWTVEGKNSSGTFITQNGVLHCGPNETATALTVRATAALIDSTDPRTDNPSKTLSVPVTGPVGANWPVQDTTGINAISLAGIDVSGVSATTMTYTLNIPKGTKIATDDVAVNTGDGSDVTTKVTKTATGYTVEITVDQGAGAPKVYTVTATEV